METQEHAGIWPHYLDALEHWVTTFIVIPIVTRLSKKLGKKKAFMICQRISIFGYIMLWFLIHSRKTLWMFIFALPFFSFGIGSLFTLMMSMTADVIDLDELNTGKRREGIFWRYLLVDGQVWFCNSWSFKWFNYMVSWFSIRIVTLDQRRGS